MSAFDEAADEEIVVHLIPPEEHRGGSVLLHPLAFD